VWFCTWLPGLRTIFSMSGYSGNEPKPAAQQRSNLSPDFSAAQKDGHQRLERGVGVGMIDAPVRG